MEFIDKTINRTLGHRLVDHFLDRQWRPDEHRYWGIDFRKRSFGDRLKGKIKSLLVSEQRGYCCYCMRNINHGETTTLEHVIPYCVNDQETLNEYAQYGYLKHNVVLQSVFEQAYTKQQTPPYPHTLAYENLVASCDGHFMDGQSNEHSGKTCNLKRLNDFIIPLFYIPNIKQEIKYKKGGLLFPTIEAYDQTIRTLGLNYVTLKRVRELWYYLSFEDFNEIERADNEYKRNTLLTSALVKHPQPSQHWKLSIDFKTEAFWNILIKYKWFYFYYKNNK